MAQLRILPRDFSFNLMPSGDVEGGAELLWSDRHSVDVDAPSQSAQKVTDF